MSDANEVAKKSLEDEVGKFGFNRPAAMKESDSDDEDEDQDMGDLDEDTADDAEDDTEDDQNTDDEDSDDEDDSEDSSDDSEDDSDEDDEDSEDDDDDETSQKKGKITFKKYNKMRSALRDARKELTDTLAKNEELEAKLPDDFQERVKALASEIGIEDPDNMAKIMALVKDAALGQVKGLEKKITDLEKQVSDKDVAVVVDEFPTEWESFEKTFLKEYPNTTTEQLREVQSKMKRLAGTKDIGGKLYINPTTKKEALDPYPLDYIFYKNRDAFESIVTLRKSKGMETGRTREITTSKGNDDDEMNLPQDASAEQIRKLDKIYSKKEAGSSDGLRAPTNSTI